MASEDPDRGGVSFALPPEVDDWLAETADRRDETPEETIRRLLTAAHAVATDDEDAPVDPNALVDPDDLDRLETRIEAQRAEFQDLLEDVRSRVIQVKRETDAKAPADHDHDSLASAGTVDALEADLEALRRDLETAEKRLEAGFDNFEEVLEHLLERAAAIEERATVLGTAVLDLRDGRDDLVQRERRREAVERLKLAANRLGVRTASCDECGDDVDLALLTAPECPTCATPIADVEPKSFFFGSHTLVTGQPPALEGAGVGATTEDAFDAVEAAESDARDENRVDAADLSYDAAGGREESE